jgi:hypothetical protein
MTKEDEHSIEECKNIFVSWQWAIGIVVSFVIVICGLSWAASAAYTSVSGIQTTQQSDINALKIGARDADTTKQLIRELIQQGKLRK